MLGVVGILGIGSKWRDSPSWRAGMFLELPLGLATLTQGYRGKSGGRNGRKRSVPSSVSAPRAKAGFFFGTAAQASSYQSRGSSGEITTKKSLSRSRG